MKNKLAICLVVSIVFLVGCQKEAANLFVESQLNQEKNIVNSSINDYIDHGDVVTLQYLRDNWIMINPIFAKEKKIVFEVDENGNEISWRDLKDGSYNIHIDSFLAFPTDHFEVEILVDDNIKSLKDLNNPSETLYLKFMKTDKPVTRK